MTYRFDIKTVSELNMREHWAVRKKRKQFQQNSFAWLWRNYDPDVSLPATITFTRYSCMTMDSDNLAGCFKHCRDALARELKVDDGSDQITWQYRQERTAKRENYFTVEIGG